MRPLRPRPLDEELHANPRVSSLDLLPGIYPFWTRHAVITGMDSIEFDSTDVAYPTAASGIYITHNLKEDPKVMMWMRHSDSSGNYSEHTEIYKIPGTIYNTAGVALENYTVDTNWSASSDQIRVFRTGITAYGSSSPLMKAFVKYFLFTDDVLQNIQFNATEHSYSGY